MSFLAVAGLSGRLTAPTPATSKPGSIRGNGPLVQEFAERLALSIDSANCIDLVSVRSLSRNFAGHLVTTVSRNLNKEGLDRVSCYRPWRNNGPAQVATYQAVFRCSKGCQTLLLELNGDHPCRRIEDAIGNAGRRS